MDEHVLLVNLCHDLVNGAVDFLLDDRGQMLNLEIGINFRALVHELAALVDFVDFALDVLSHTRRQHGSLL
jgi:hypothetical protein